MTDDDIAVWMRHLAASPLEGPPLPDAQRVLWRAAAWDGVHQRQRVTRPLDVGDFLAMSGASVSAVILLGWITGITPQIWASPLFVFVTLVSVALMTAAAMVYVGAIRTLGLWQFQ
jgi:hypothetical protein